LVALAYEVGRAIALQIRAR